MKHPIGTRIRFTKRIHVNFNHTFHLYANEGETGKIVSQAHSTSTGWEYGVETDSCSDSFGVNSDEFTVISQEGSR